MFTPFSVELAKCGRFLKQNNRFFYVLRVYKSDSALDSAKQRSEKLKLSVMAAGVLLNLTSEVIHILYLFGAISLSRNKASL